MSDDDELRARIAARIAARRTGSDDDGEAPDDAAPRPLAPVRPWLLRGGQASDAAGDTVGRRPPPVPAGRPQPSNPGVVLSGMASPAEPARPAPRPAARSDAGASDVPDRGGDDGDDSVDGTVPDAVEEAAAPDAGDGLLNRAGRWLFARRSGPAADGPAPDEPVGTAEPEAKEPGESEPTGGDAAWPPAREPAQPSYLADAAGAAAYAPGADLARRHALADAAQAAQTEPEQPATAAQDEHPAEATGTTSGLRDRRRRRPEEAAEPAAPVRPPSFHLPEPDPAFASSWTRPVDDVPDDAAPVADEPARATPVPRPVPATARRPSPAILALPEPAVEEPVEEPVEDAPPAEPRPADLHPAPAPRPHPATAGTAAATRPRPRPAGAGDEPADEPALAAPGPDLSKFLDATEAKPGDDVDEEAEAERLSRPRGGRSRVVRFLLRFAVTAAIAVLAALLLRAYVVEPYYIPSQSMEPTLVGCPACTDDHVLVDKVSYRIHDPRRGDIIVFDRPPNAGDTEPQLIKRIVGLPGDQLSLRNGKVIVNGTILVENYVNKKCTGGTTPLSNKTSWTVPDGELFVMGDNRCQSLDSRAFGPIKESTVIGRAFAIIWPLSRIRTL